MEHKYLFVSVYKMNDVVVEYENTYCYGSSIENAISSFYSDPLKRNNTIINIIELH